MRIENFSRVAQLVDQRCQLKKVLNEPISPDRVLHLIGFPHLVYENRVVEDLKKRIVDVLALAIAREARQLMEVIDAELIELGMSID